ncbi:MAG: hypothetical protein GXP29_09845, partial [Planctomycetes bacterium]|nr:hypothetical protein [Planctomycetota bacterium]
MPPDEPIAKPDASRIDSPASDVDQPADMPWILAAILCLIPGLLLADFLRPALFHQGLLDAVNEASSRNEPMLDKLDYLAIGLLVAAIGFVLGAMVLRKRGLLFRLVAVTYCVTLPLALAELFLRVTTQPRLYQPNMTQIEHPRPEVMPGITGESRFTMNALGLRGPEWQEDAYKILCIGGSTTICTYLDDDETWPALLMAR